MNPEALAWIEKQKPRLVQQAEQYVAKTKLYEPKSSHPDKPEVSGSQLRNLLNAAQGGSSLAVLINFLRYQIGRGKRGWEHQESGKALLELFDRDLRQLATERAGAGEEGGAGAAAAEGERYELEAHLAAQLLGFIIREYTYRCRLARTKP